MVITDLPFNRHPMMHSRYFTIRRPGHTEADDENTEEKQTKEYATFLKEQERKCGPDGFLDSGKYTHTFSTRNFTAGKPPKFSPRNVVDLKLKMEQEKKGHDKTIKLIEDHMWQHKQEERELKRVEGDIFKNQRAVTRSLRDYEQAVAKKRLQEEKKFNQGMEKYTDLQRDHTHTKEDLTKQRIESNITKEQELKDKGRKVELAKSDLARKFRSKVDEMELRKIEVNRLVTEFETKLRTKEEEQFKLKQELAELAIKLNMEAQKGRQEKTDDQKEKRKETIEKIKEDRSNENALENKLMKSDGNVKTALMNRRKLSADLTLTRSHLGIKAREEGRHLQDTQIRLEDNSNVQRQLNEAALHTDLELKSKKIDQKLYVHENRRVKRITTMLKDKKDKSVTTETVYAEKAAKRHLDQRRREHEDHLKHFQKNVSKDEEIEHALFNSVRESEYSRQKQEQAVKRMQNKIHDAKRSNAVKLKSEMAEALAKEQELQQNFIREKAELDKMHSRREESYNTLQQHRARMKTDVHYLQKHEQEHMRLLRVGVRSEPTFITEIY